MAALDNYTLGWNLGTDFAHRTMAILKKVCTQIVGEADTEHGGSVSPIALQKRHAKALQYLNDKTNDSVQVVLQVIASLGTLTEESTDNDIEFTINSVFNDLSGVTQEDLKTYLDTSTRVLMFKEANQLVDHAPFVEAVQGRALKLSIYFKELHEGSWGSLTNSEKKQHNFSKLNLERGALEDNVSFARVFCTYLINDSVGVDIPDDGFLVERVSEEINGSTTVGDSQLEKAFNIMMDNVQIDTPE